MFTGFGSDFARAHNEWLEPPEEVCPHGVSVYEPCWDCGHDPDEEDEDF